MDLVDNKKHVVWIIIDGCHRDTFYNLFESGKLPNMRRAMGATPAVVEKATTCFPSVTVVCLSALATGCWFKNTGLTGNVWYDRSWVPFGGRAYLSELDQTLASYDRSLWGWPTVLLPEMHCGGMINNDIYPETKTIYETLTGAGLTSFCMFNYVGRGATIWRRPSRIDMIHYALIDKKTHNYALFDRLMISAAKNLVKKHGLPNLLTLYFAGNDGNSHLNGVGTQAAYLRDVFDVQMGRFFETLQGKHDLKDINFIISADHGQTGFPRGGKHNYLWLDKIVPMLRDTGPGTFVDGGEISAIDPAANVVFGIGTGASNGIYIRNRATLNWTDSPRLHEDVLPVAHAILRAADTRMSDRPAYIGDFLDFIALRENLHGQYMIYQADYPYDSPGRLVTVEEFFEGKEDRYPDAVAQLHGLENPWRGPDLIYVLDYDRKGWYFAGGNHLGNHGAMTVEDTFIPLIFSGPGVGGGALPHGRAIDVAPTIASFFGLDMPSADGRVLALK
jgi:hypothetical protein